MIQTSLDDLARLAWAQLWQVTAVALVIGAVAQSCCRNRPRLAYALWMLVVVKSIVPPVWSSPTGLFSWALSGIAGERFGSAGVPPGVSMNPPATTPNGAVPARAAPGAGHRTARARAMDQSDLYVVLFAVWSTGLLTCAGFVLGKRTSQAKLIRQSSLPVDGRNLAALADLSRRLGVKQRVRLIVTSRPIGPAVFGLLRPTILLPGPLLSGASPEQIELILAHELVHIRRGDVLAGTLQLVAQLIWWFHPLVWWANQQAGRERERCCDEEVLSSVGCKPALYARTLLNVLEQKVRLRSLVAHPGVRALEVTSLRLESIMRYAGTDHRRISRLVFAVGLVVLIPGMGLTTKARSLPSDDVGVAAVTAPPKSASAPLTMRGVVREKGTGRPVAGARVTVVASTEGDARQPGSRSLSNAITDGAGRYSISDLPRARRYALAVLPKLGAPYLNTSRRVEVTDDKGPVTADVEVVRGIPFRVRILDRKTGRPVKGTLVYYPVNPNNPFARGVMGSVGLVEKGGTATASFYDARQDDQGEFHGAVLSGPGFLGFSHPYRPGDESRADRKPVVSYPDGKENVELEPHDRGGPFGFVPISSDPLLWTGLPLGQFDAVIAIAPRDGVEKITYEIRLPPDNRPK